MANYDFQINDIDFTVPPTSISVYKEGLNYSVKSLRTRSSVKVASGNGVYHAQVNIIIPPKELLSLHRLICQIKNNPFIYVKNSFLKDSLEINEIYNRGAGNYLYFTTMGLNINNHPSSPGAFIVELDLRYFNTKPYMENLCFFNEIKEGSFDIGLNVRRNININKAITSFRVTDPKSSPLYVRYCNFLQISYLLKYFNIDLKTDLSLSEDSKHDLQDGTSGLQDIVERDQIIELIYETSKYTQIKGRNFINLKLRTELAQTLKNFLTNGITDKMSLEERVRKREDNLNLLRKSKGKTGKELRLHLKGITFKGPFDCREEKAVAGKEISLIEKEGRYAAGEKPSTLNTFKDINAPATGEEVDFRTEEKNVKTSRTYKDFIKNGSYEVDVFSDLNTEDTISINFKAKLTAGESTTQGEQAQHEPFIFTPTVLIWEKIETKDDGIERLYFKTLDNLVFIISTKRTETESFFRDNRLHGDVKIDGKRYVPAQTIIGIFGQDSEIKVTLSRKLFERLPMYKNYKNKVLKEKGGKGKNIAKEYIELEKFLSENYQPYYDRKESSHNIYETVLGINFLDYKDYELNTVLGKPKAPRITGTSEIRYDTNSIITSINGSLRHITPSIPILGQESPTHQFLGSMEPHFQISLIGKGHLNKMPDSFLSLEKQRKDSQENAKNFNEVPDAANFAINSLITKLLGSYEKSENVSATVSIGGVDVSLFKEKYNFSLNSTNTFTVEGQPQTYGMNIHIQETRSYKEEEIRPAFSNYVNKNLSAKFFNQVLGSKIKLPKNIIEPSRLNSSSKIQSSPLKSQLDVSDSNYQWMNWKTKSISSDQWYKKPKEYGVGTVGMSLVSNLKDLGKDVSFPLNKEMAKVKKYFIDSPQMGTLWEENKPRGAPAFSQTGSSEVQSDRFLDPDKCAYELCKIVSEVIKHLEKIFPDKSLQLALTSTLRINSDIDYVKQRGNHKIGTGIDMKIIGVNQTELGIYIYLMQILGYIKDPVPSERAMPNFSKREGAFLALGFYNSSSIKRKNLLGPSANGWLHLDLNARVRKFVINDGGEEHVFHVPSVWLKRRGWASYSRGQAAYPIVLGYRLYDNIKSIKNIDKDVKVIQELRAYDSTYKTLKEYKEDLIKAHETLYGNTSKEVKSEKVAAGPKTLISFWNEKLKTIVSEREEVPLENLELKIPDDKCGANITIYNESKRHVINLYERDATNIDWYPASTIKFVAAIASVYSVVHDHKIYNIEGTEVKFGTIKNELATFNYKRLLEKAIKESDNLSYSLLVAIARKPYINNTLLKNSTIKIRRPIGFSNKLYTEKATAWKGYKDITIVGRSLENTPITKDIAYKGDAGMKDNVKASRLLRSSEGTVADFSKFMIDYVEEYSSPEFLDDGEEDAINNSTVYTILNECLTADKSHNQGGPNISADKQNALKNALKLKIGDLGEFEIYHKPGLASAPVKAISPSGAQAYFVSDCLYFSTEESNKDNFGITLWGRVDYEKTTAAKQAANVTVRNREFLTSNSYYGGTHVSLTELLSYCMKYSSELKKYIKGE